jgi:hypothetical protein
LLILTRNVVYNGLRDMICNCANENVKVQKCKGQRCKGIRGDGMQRCAEVLGAGMQRCRGAGRGVRCRDTAVQRWAEVPPRCKVKGI